MAYYLKNIFRSIFKNKGTYLGTISIITLGILIFIAMTDVMFNLKDSVNIYFKDYHFANVFAKVKQMPRSELAKLEEIEGIDLASGRLSQDVRLLLDESTHIITLHLLGYDKTDTLNQFKSSPSNQKLLNDHLLLGNKMYDTYRFHIGTPLKLAIDDRVETFYLAGTFQTPEYIYAIPSSGIQTPDSETYDIACINKEKLEALLGMPDAVTELGFTLLPGYTFSDVKTELEQRLSPYGLLSLVERKDQISNYVLNSELDQLFSMAITLPAIFLVISIFMMYIILKKMIDQDRGLIGTMKAFGFTDREMLFCYMKQGLLTGILGGLLGSILAIPLAKITLGFYMGFFNLPSSDFHLFLSNRFLGILLAILTSLTATYLGIKEVLHINPSEAMRPITPILKSHITFPALLNKYLNSRQKMGIRTILRNKLRNLVIAFAIAFPFALIAVLASFDDIIEQMLFSQFTHIQTYDLKVTLNNYTNYTDALSGARQLDGVYNIEATAEYNLHLRHENRSDYATLIAINPNSALYKIMDSNNKYYEPPEDGIIINSKIANKLGIHTGDLVEITNITLAPNPVLIPVTKVIDESLVGGCYISIDAISKYFNVNKLANAIIFNVEPGKLDEVKATLTTSRNISSVTDTNSALKNYNRLMESMVNMIYSFEVLAILSGVILIYNISNISIRERKNEFGTLTIFGTTFKEIIQIISFEQMINFIIGILLGFPFSILIGNLIEYCIPSDLYTLELHISLSGYIFSFVLCLIIMFLSLIAVLKTVKNIEPTDVLKERE